MMSEFSTVGVLIGLGAAVVLILFKVHPAYSLIFGALAGGLIGGGSFVTTMDAMASGAGGMMSSVLRIMASGILAGALIRTGSARKIAETIVDKMGHRLALAAVALATMAICAVGVFVDISVITVAPIALAIGQKSGISKQSLLLAMIGGGKAGNLISPNPNTIATAEAFGVDLTSLMLQNMVPAVLAVTVAILLSTLLAGKKNGLAVSDAETDTSAVKLPGFLSAVSGPLTVIVLLALRPLVGITIDPLLALPAGGLVCMLATGNIRRVIKITEFGLSKVIGVSVLLIGTGAIAGIIQASALLHDVIDLLDTFNMPAFVLSPLAGILLAGTTASTTAGATIASRSFAGTLIRSGVPALSAGAMIHAGSTVLDSLPHGSFFHATGGSVSLTIKDRRKLIPYEACVGLTATVASVVMFLIFFNGR